MMKTETLLPLDIEVNVLNQNQSQREQVWLIKSQIEILEIVARVLVQTISEYLTGTILSMLECDVDETVPNKLKEKFSREPMEVIQS